MLEILISYPLHVYFQLRWAMTDALRNSNVAVCDEIGPMELKSREFTFAVSNLLYTDKK
jgi:nucleoside-triphosphatase THEP1